MEVSLEDISLSDCRIIDMSFIPHEGRLSISAEDSFYIPEKRSLGKIELEISNWSAFNLKKHVSTSAFETGVTSELMAAEIESFALIQEIVLEANVINLNGFSRESGHWLMYTFANANCRIRTLY